MRRRRPAGAKPSLKRPASVAFQARPPSRPKRNRTALSTPAEGEVHQLPWDSFRVGLASRFCGTYQGKTSDFVGEIKAKEEDSSGKWGTRSLGTVEGAPLRTALRSRSWDRRTVSLQRSEGTCGGLGVEGELVGQKRRRRPPRLGNASSAHGLWCPFRENKRRRKGKEAKEGEGTEEGEQKRGQRNSLQRVHYVARKKRKKGEKEKAEEKEEKNCEGDGGSFKVEPERDEPRSEFQASQGVFEQDKGIKLNRRHIWLRRGSAVSGNPAGAESSKILSRTAEQASLEGCEELSGVRGRKICRRKIRDTGDAEVIATDPGRRESDEVNAERIPDFVHCDRSYPRRKSPTKHAWPRPETRSHRNGIKGIILGPRREGGDHQSKGEPFFRSRVEAREDLELGTAEQCLGTRLPKRKRRKRRVDERRSGTEGAEGNKRKSERSSQRERATRGTQDGSKANVLTKAVKPRESCHSSSAEFLKGASQSKGNWLQAQVRTASFRGRRSCPSRIGKELKILF